MRTVGQIIHSERQKKGLSIDQLSALTKIDSKYIEALELNQYQDLPSETFIKGFIRSLSQRLSLDQGELIAIFRRDFKQPKLQGVKAVPKKSSRVFHTQSLPYVIGGLVFTIYLIFQFRAVITPPRLKILQPKQSAVLTSPIEVRGETSPDTIVSINGDVETRPDGSGLFLSRINLPIGENSLEIKSTNRFSRSSVEKISVTIISK